MANMYDNRIVDNAISICENTTLTADIVNICNWDDSSIENCYITCNTEFAILHGPALYYKLQEVCY